ncbi:MAG TPA: nuclear transport factor 2 family protein [Azospirillaceae bacterium]|nr:nuclear transport factor 2 family protein [Azospirillaceae bacterium]
MDIETLGRGAAEALTAMTDRDRVEACLGFFRDDALFVLEDTPFILDKEGFRGHMAFHLGTAWEWVELKTWRPDARIFGATGLFTADFTLRGKPRNSGFRQRHGALSLVCHHDGQGWRGLKLHLSTLLSQIHEASPG